MFVEQPQSIVEIVAPTSGGRLGTGCEIGACSLLGIEERPQILLLSLVLTTLIVSNAAPQRDAARHVRVMSVLFKAGELERPIYAYASYASFFRFLVFLALRRLAIWLPRSFQPRQEYSRLRS